MKSGKKDQHYPRHAYPTLRAYKKAKRADIRQAIEALGDLRFGCAWMPLHQNVDKVQALLEELRDAASVAKWGR